MNTSTLQNNGTPQFIISFLSEQFYMNNKNIYTFVTCPPLHTGDILTEFLKLGSTKESNEEILGRGLMEEEGKGRQSFNA